MILLIDKFRCNDKNCSPAPQEDEIPQGRSPKRRQDGEEVNFKVVDRRKGTKKTVVVELADLEKEYLLLVARLNLVQFDKNTSTAIGTNWFYFPILFFLL